MTNLPNIKKADVVHIDTNGLYWIYAKEEEVLLINKDGIKTIPFCDLPQEELQNVLDSLPKTDESNFIFKDGDTEIKLKDLIKEKKWLF